MTLELRDMLRHYNENRSTMGPIPLEQRLEMDSSGFQVIDECQEIDGVASRPDSSRST